MDRCLVVSILLLAVLTSRSYSFVAMEDKMEDEYPDYYDQEELNDGKMQEDYDYNSMEGKSEAGFKLQSNNIEAEAGLMSEVKDLSVKINELLAESDENTDDKDEMGDQYDDMDDGYLHGPEEDLPEWPADKDSDSELPGDEEPDVELPGDEEPDVELPGDEEPDVELPGDEEPDVELPGDEESDMKTGKELDTLENSLDTTAEEMNVPANSLSLVTRYVGVGYDLIHGSPEGDFSRGGIDPGIKITSHIFDFTFTQNKNVYYMKKAMALPNEVNFHAFSSCTKRQDNKVYTGAESYRKDVSAGVAGSGSYGFYSFSASVSVRTARSSTENKKRVYMDKKEICNYGRARLIPGKVTTAFQEAVKRLPTSYNEKDYLLFIREWGNHIIEVADLGTKFIRRFSSSYSDALKYTLNSGSARFSGSYNGIVASGSISLSADYLNEKVTSNSQFGSQLTEYTIGTREAPLPIWIKLRPIYFALQEKKYWTDLNAEDTYESLSISKKMENLKKAFDVYPLKFGSLLTDPNINIPLTWPEGRYAFPEPREGCPVGFARGCRLQDTENKRNGNWFYYSSRLKGRFNKNFIEMCFCVKRTSTRSPFQWPPGRYCIARYGQKCPARFHSGYIFWDDEDKKNKNKAWGILPDGKKDRNTWRFYCCRSDGDVKNNIVLPTKKPFVLYQYLYRGCQQVAGMRAEQVIIHYDDEDKNNDDRCKDGPYNPGCSNNHKIYMCRYRPR